MSIEELLEQFDEALDSGMKMPGKRVMVNAEELRAVIDDIRLNIPSEIKQARGIVADRALSPTPSVKPTALLKVPKSVQKQWSLKKRLQSSHRKKPVKSFQMLRQKAVRCEKRLKILLTILCVEPMKV